LLSLDHAVGGNSEADEQRFTEESTLRAGDEKGLPLRAELDSKSGGHVREGLVASGARR
jgi:hypothetical protein